MSEPTSSGKQPMDESRVAGIIKDMGGVKALRERHEEVHRVFARLDRERFNLMEMYPDKWVAVGKDGVLAVGDSMEEVFAEVESAGLSGSEFEVEFLDSDPPDLIL